MSGLEPGGISPNGPWHWTTEPSPRSRAAELLEIHRIGAFSGSDTACACDRTWRSNLAYRAHLADALAAAGLLAGDA